MAQFRPATPSDSSDLAVLADAATRRLVSWIWGQSAEVGQSSFEVGRQVIRSDSDSLSHYTNWRVAELDGLTVGGLNSYVAPPMSDAAPDSDVLLPLHELKAIATGSWYVSTASVFPECRGQGVGRAVLDEAERLARGAGIDWLSLIVASFNPDAKRLYERVGYSEAARRPFVPFPGSDPEGDWTLMSKSL